MTDNSKNGTLYVVATPIGNLEDMGARAGRILDEVSLIACEDTRHTRKLLNHLQIRTPLISYYREKEKTKADLLLSRLLAGEDIALVSDAGTPALSDPGSILVRQAREKGITVRPVPGPSALAAAVSAAGLPGSGFFFGGFPPARKKSRQDFFRTLVTLPCPLVFYESPHRIKSCLQDCITVFGDRHAILFRELTKMFETSYEDSLPQLLDAIKEGIKGEIVLIVHGQDESRQPLRTENLAELLTWYRKQPDMTLKEAVARIASDLDLPRNLVYREALAVWKKDE
jgi:16S rRNA (cytidine1402-2'-O)-methyltransferase